MNIVAVQAVAVTVGSRYPANVRDDIQQECILRFFKMKADKQAELLASNELLETRLRRFANTAYKRMTYNQSTELLTAVASDSQGLSVGRSDRTANAPDASAFDLSRKLKGVSRRAAGTSFGSRTGAKYIRVSDCDARNGLINQFYSFFDCERYIVRQACMAREDGVSNLDSLLTRRE